MTFTQLYTVPIIPDGLRRVELIKQCADTFDYLDSISQDIFNRISIRLNVYRAQLNKFDEHIQHSDAHIDHIKGSKCAIQVHSSTRYPVRENRSTFKSIFQCNTHDEPPVFHYDLFHSSEPVDKYINSKLTDDTLIVLKQYEENFLQQTKTTDLNGLGRLPKNIKSVVSFLKHNTKENPYIQPRKTDSLNTATRVRKQIDEPIQSRFLETSLPTFYERMFERSVKTDFNYNPTLGLVPQLSLPDNLPELDNYATFADNTFIDWTKQHMTSIAPSSFVSVLPNINDLSLTTITAPPVESPEPTVSVLPPADIPALIPLTSASTSIPVPPPLPPPIVAAPPSLVPILAPPFSSTIPSISTPLTVADESQATAINTVDDSGNSSFPQILNFPDKNYLKPVTKSNAADKVPLPSSSIMDALEVLLHVRRRLIAAELQSQTDDSDDGFD